jgi:hypothetical protein
VNGADHALSGAIVADRLPRVLDAAVQRGRCHVPMAPNAVEELLFRYHSVATGEQMRQHVEDLRLDVQALPAASKLVQPRVELVLAEGVYRGFGRIFLHGVVAGRAMGHERRSTEGTRAPWYRTLRWRATHRQWRVSLSAERRAQLQAAFLKARDSVPVVALKGVEL